MSPVRVTLRRTIGRLCNLYSTALVFAGFLAAVGALFAFNLTAAEGGDVPLVTIWTVSVSPILPVLASLLAMDVWSEERNSGRIELLLSAPVREREFTFGKFFGVWILTLAGIVISQFATLVFVAVYAPNLIGDLSVFSFLPGVLALAMQGALWTAVAVAVSAIFRHSAATACFSVAILSALPRGIWWALLAWAPQGRLSFGEMPLDAHAFDLSLGLISTGTVLSYIVLTSAALMVASKLVARLRLVGRGAAAIRASTVLTVLLAMVLAGSVMALAIRLNVTLDLPIGPNGGTRFSARTRNVLSDARGEVVVTAFVSRKDPRFRPIGHFLRALSSEATAVGGARITVRYVDPRWDLGAAERLVRSGATENSLVFERGRRVEVLPLKDGYDERLCASAILKVAMPPQRRAVYWTKGHGETPFLADGTSNTNNAAYGSWGLSDIARDLSRDGYRNLPIDLAGDAQVPSDCALIVVAGAKDDFSRIEIGRLDTYLKQGGRLLVMLNSPESGGLATMLSSWGMRPTAATLTSVRTLSGTDAIVSEFGEHAVSAPLAGSQIVLEKPVAFMPSAAVESGGGADRIEFSELAKVGGICVAAVTERGAGAGKDLAIRPTRIVAIGDASFVMNGQLAARANANRDFFLNCVAYLSGTAAVTEAGMEANRLVSGMDRAARARFAIASAAVFPAVMLLVFVGVVRFRRRLR